MKPIGALKNEGGLPVGGPGPTENKLPAFYSRVGDRKLVDDTRRTSARDADRIPALAISPAHTLHNGDRDDPSTVEPNLPVPCPPRQVVVCRSVY
jgi:hypothetical protein